MEIKLTKLTLVNFKGIGNFEFKPDGKNATIQADNRKGKTTVADSFRYLLFGKNTKGQADFAIQPQDK
ncbi:MAG TPA: hypothetical protein ENH91_08920, partial [Leeuwenhoekiella sp.]|nr:hypothetical protein [Leeuwenhoekiella sp.]